MNEQTQFFYDHAGWSEPPGREACARELAAAETWLGERYAEYIVDHDPDVATTATEEQIARIEAGETFYMQALLKIDGEVVGSLGGIEVTDENDPYLRVIRAELASEAQYERNHDEQSK